MSTASLPSKNSVRLRDALVSTALTTLALTLALAHADAHAQACPAGRSCFYMPPALATPPGYTVGWDMVLASPRGTISGTWRGGAGAPTAFTVSPGSPLIVPLSTTLGTAGAYNTIEERGIFIEASSSELIVNHRLIVGPWQSSSTIKNANYALGTRFRLGAYNLNRDGTADTGFDYASVYAPFGGTVTFTAPPSAAAPFWQAAATLSFSVTLAPGQTYVARTIPGGVCTRETMGALVTSSDPIVVETGGRGWSGICDVAGGCGDDGADNVLPTTGIGTQYVVHSFPTPSTEGEDVAIVADTADTEVRINGSLVATLAAGGVHRATFSGATTLMYIETSAPAYVYQNTGRAGCEIDVAIIPPVVLAPVGDWVTDFNVSGAGQVGVVIATAAIGTLRLDGSVPTFLRNATVPGRPDLTAVTFDVTGGNHSVRAGADFQLGLATSTSGTGLFGYFTPFRIPGCGDGVVGAGEGCDDGNLVDGDGCSGTCRIEVGFPGCASSGDCVPSGRCDEGTCVARCNSDAACNDSNPCTVDLCNVSGACENDPVAAGSPGACAGGLVCSGAPSNTCVACVSAAQCAAPTPLCDTTTNTCVECLLASHCDDGNACTTDVCAAGACGSTGVEEGTACPDGVCTATSVCVACIDDSRCAAPTPRCDLTAFACVQCLEASECDDGNECTTNACGAGSCSTTALAAGAACSLGVCTPAAACAVVAVTIVVPDDGAAIANATPTIAGTATPGTTVSVSVDGVLVGTATAGADGMWALALGAPLADGMHVATAEVSTSNGSAMDMSTFIVDTVTEVAITSPADGGTTLDSTPSVRGTGEVGATVVVTLDGEEIGSATVGADGTWVVTVAEPLPNGTYTAEARATDAAGNTASATSTFTIDANTEVAISSPANGTSTNDTTPTISGTAVPGATIVVTVEVDGETREIGTVTADGEGLWTIDVMEPLPEGTHTATATATDPAGNMASDESTFTVDTSTTVAITDVDPSGRVSGTGEPGSTVVVTVNGVEAGSTTVGEDGTWTLEISPLGPGNYEVTAEATDAAGNTASDSTTIVVERADAGFTPDAGFIPDAGPADGGFDAGLEGSYSGGALCAASPSGDDPWPLALLSLAALALWRRRR